VKNYQAAAEGYVKPFDTTVLAAMKTLPDFLECSATVPR
jgi:hypothetical protein